MAPLTSFFPDDPRLPCVEGPADDSEYELRSTTMAEVEAGLHGVVGRLAADPSRWILIIEIGPTAAMVEEMGCAEGVCVRGYVQWLCYEDGSFVAEAASNDSLHPAHARSDDDEAQLLELGWRAPESERKPNFWAVYADPHAAGEGAALAVTTMVEVFDVRRDESLLVKMVESRFRGSTPLAQRERASGTSP